MKMWFKSKEFPNEATALFECGVWYGEHKDALPENLHMKLKRVSAWNPFNNRATFYVEWEKEDND